MEVSKPLQADISNIQNQLKIAIQNHQIVVLKMRDDPTNIQMKKQLLGFQRHIILLGESQKRLVDQLRKELEANSTNSTISIKNGAVNNNNNLKSRDRPTCIVRDKCVPVRPSSVSSISSSTTSEDSEDSQRDREEVVAKCFRGTNNDPTLATKLQFMSAVGLVTREVLSELQNRRVERKRRSTANHTQFVYGSSWDVSKRKKNSYLTAGFPPPTRQLTRSLKVEPLIKEQNEEKAATSTHSETTSLHIPGLPASLTIERVQAPVCVVCRRIGSLTVCNNCSAEYHISCSAEKARCPQCSIKQEQSNIIKERELEKQTLVDLNIELNSEKDTLDHKTDELRSALQAQANSRKELLRTEELTRKAIQRLQDFVNIIKSSKSPSSPS